MVGVVVGNYQLVRKLGEGGMGAVYLGQHTLLGRRAAIKVLLPALSARQDIVTRFFNEARAVTSISDPGIVQVFDFGYHSDGSAFIVMEYLEGEALDQRLAKLRRFPIADALRLCRQVATSLAAAHAQHIIHRDLKPENIFLVRDAEVASGERSKILDFGIAKLSDEETSKVKTHVGALMGTPVYMSPEQCRGLPDIDHRADIYALACVTFHLMAGRPPFDGEGMGDLIAAHITEAPPALSSLVPGVPPSVDALLLRCMAKDPAQRYQTMTELAAAITAVLHQLASEAVPGFVVSLDSAPVGMRTPVPGASHGHTPAPGTPPPAMMRTPVPHGSVPGMKHTPVPQGTVPGASAGMTHPPPRRALTPVPGAHFTAPTGSPAPAPGAPTGSPTPVPGGPTGSPTPVPGAHFTGPAPGTHFPTPTGSPTPVPGSHFPTPTPGTPVPGTHFTTPTGSAPSTPVPVPGGPTGSPTPVPGAHFTSPTPGTPVPGSHFTAPPTGSSMPVPGAHFTGSPTPVPGAHFTSPTPGTPVPAQSPHAMASVAGAPTTLGGSSGQVGPAWPPRAPGAPAPARSRFGLWIAGVLVVIAFGVGMAVLTGRGDGDGKPPMATVQYTPPASPPAPTPTPAPVVTPTPTPTPAPPAPAPVPTEGSDAAPAPTAGSGSGSDAAALPPTEGSGSSAGPGPAVQAVATPSPRPAARKCSKAEFATVYDAAVAAPGAVRSALRSLRQCHESGAIGDADFDRIQAALVAKL